MEGELVAATPSACLSSDKAFSAEDKGTSWPWVGDVGHGWIKDIRRMDDQK